MQNLPSKLGDCDHFDELVCILVKQVLNIFDSYGTSDAAKGDLGLHRLIEALKHMFAVRMNLGDPAFVDTSKYASDMLSSSFAKKIQQKIFDNTTFPPEYYLQRHDLLFCGSN